MELTLLSWSQLNAPIGALILCPCSTAPTMSARLQYLDHFHLFHLHKTCLIRCLIIIMLEWPVELVIAVWSLSAIYPQHGSHALCLRASVIIGLGHWKPSPGLYETIDSNNYFAARHTCSTHFKQNAKTAMPEQIRWREDQNPLLPYQAATGCWNDCSCMLKADPHTAKTCFHTPCEVMKLGWY